MKRFEMHCDGFGGVAFEEEPDGMWVDYDDAQSEIKKLAGLLVEGQRIVTDQAAEIERLEARYYVAMDNVKFLQAKMDKDK